jgi:raffinose/stachyose/melibiose transport system permease protein
MEIIFTSSSKKGWIVSAVQKGRRLFSVLFLTPGFVLFTVFIVIAIIMTFNYSLTKWDAISTPKFVGLGNYERILNDSSYRTAMKNNIIVVFFAFIAQNPVAYIFAVMVSFVKRGNRYFQSVFFLPVVISTVATATMFVLLMNGDIGPINILLKPLGLDHNWLSDSRTVLGAVIAPQLWQYLGIHFMIFLAGIQNIPAEVLESAKIDGTSRLRMVWSIIVPLSWETIQISLIYTFIGCLKTFDYSWVMTRGGPGTLSTFLATHLYKQAFMQNAYGYGSAIAITILLYSLIFTFIFKLMAKKFDVQ